MWAPECASGSFRAARPITLLAASPPTGLGLQPGACFAGTVCRYVSQQPSPSFHKQTGPASLLYSHSGTSAMMLTSLSSSVDLG